MKTIITALIAVFFISSAKADIIPVKLAEYIKKYDANGWLIPGKEMNDFKVAYGEDKLIMQIVFNVTDYKKLTVQKGLHLTVTHVEDGAVMSILDWYWKPLTQNKTIYTDCGFNAGEYTITLFDNDNPDKVFAKRVITVKPNEAKAANKDGFEYDRSQFKIWTCKDVDEKTWKAIAPTGKIKAGSCAVLFFESKTKIKNKGSMRWGIYKVSPEGVEMLLSQKDQGVSLNLTEWSKLYYEECDAFNTPGTYRIYIATKVNSESLSNTNSDNYYQKAELIVE
ncbi:MAG: hypothetical protein ABIX01_05080 [Chitinophagaceae bacterium]